MENVYRSFYTTDNTITSYMVTMIRPSAADKILEPCGGEGAFIDALLETDERLSIDTCDLNGQAVEILKQKYESHPQITVRQADTLTDRLFDEYAETGYYDKIIGNPPYGGWQDYEHRAELKKKYAGYHVKETYALFLLRCVSMLKDHGILSFIIPDTFLYLHNHTALRNYLLRSAKIREILIFPSSFFPGVSFGYSKLSIVTVERTLDEAEALQNTVQVIKGLRTVEDISQICRREKLSHLETVTLRQQDILNNDCHAFVLSNDRLSAMIAAPPLTLGDLADCVTGIYSGDNPAYLAVRDSTVRGAGHYPVIPDGQVDFSCRSLAGTAPPFRYIPIVKGPSKTKYVRSGDSWLIDWTPQAIDHYHRDKKARFQNPSFYFKTGIAVPMVKSSRINATLMEGRVFDQSIVGIFPREQRYLYYLLGFLNSDVANRLIHLINPTANNSSNYLKKLPVVLPEPDALEEISGLVRQILAGDDSSGKQEQINDWFYHLFGLDET